MPFLTTACGFKPTRLWPSSDICPAVGARNPVIRLNTVVLPAPLGPMSPSTSPGCRANDRSETARRPPKTLLSPRTSSNAMASPDLETDAAARPRCPRPVHDAGDSLPARGHLGRAAASVSRSGLAMALLEVRGLSKVFGGLRAVSDLSFALHPGEVLGLIGPNGAGKITVFNLITGFLAPTAGQISLEGQSLVGLKPHAVVKKGIARTFQVVKPFRHLTALENVTLAAFLHERSRPRAQARAQQILARVQLSARSAAGAADLTLSEQKRLELARALATDPKILFQIGRA